MKIVAIFLAGAFFFSAGLMAKPNPAAAACQTLRASGADFSRAGAKARARAALLRLARYGRRVGRVRYRCFVTRGSHAMVRCTARARVCG